MHKTVSFKKKIITAAIASATAAITLSNAALAQNESEEIVITGIRASLVSSMNQKRESSGINDMITSEDIGKFPDTNLAESLQRIPGVAINRDAGEGSKVTVRGLGAQYNLVTQNGRTVAKTTGDRSFDFADIPAELIAGVTIHKTADATVDSGGMGATIDYTSIRPLNSPGQKVVLSAKAISDQSWGGGTTPELFGLYSNTFADDTIGVSAAIGFQDRESSFARSRIANSWRTRSSASGTPAGNEYNGDATLFGVPQDIRYTFETAKRERINGQVVLQWKPVDNITATLDLDKYQRTIHADQSEISAWFDLPGASNTNTHAVWTQKGRIATPSVYYEAYVDGNGDPASHDVAMAPGQYYYKYTGDTQGLNVAWKDVTEGLDLAFDAYHSEAERSPDGDGRTAGGINMGMSGFTRPVTVLAVNGDVMPFRFGGTAPTAAQMRVTGSIFSNDLYNSAVDGYKLSGKYKLTDEQTINFGVASTEVYNRVRGTSVQQNSWGGVSMAKDGDLNGVLKGSEQSALGHFDGSLGNFDSLKNLPGVDAQQVLATTYQADKYFAPKARDVAILAQKLYPTLKADGQNGDCGNAFCGSLDYKNGTDRATTETTTAFYVSYAYHEGFFSSNLGLRYEKTDVDSRAANAVYSSIDWSGLNELTVVSDASKRDYVSRSASYDNLLPSLDMTFDVGENVKLRTAVSKTITRAGYDKIASNVSVGGTNIQTDYFSGSSGNPAVKPYQSLNLDFAAEWYYAEGSYISAGVFQKIVSNFIIDKETRIYDGKYNPNLPALYDPFNSAWVDEAKAALPNTDGNGWKAYIYNKYNGQDGISQNGNTIHIVGTSSNSRPAELRMTQAANSDQEKQLWGLEFAVQHLFGESGYGVQFNATTVDSDSIFNINSDSTSQTPFTGVGDSANFVGFYDKDGWNVRLAYNWRGKYLTNPNDNSSPEFVNNYYQLDAGISYQVTDNLKLSLDGINITNNAYETSNRTQTQKKLHDETGARYMLGASYSF